MIFIFVVVVVVVVVLVERCRHRRIIGGIGGFQGRCVPPFRLLGFSLLAPGGGGGGEGGGFLWVSWGIATRSAFNRLHFDIQLAGLISLIWAELELGRRHRPPFFGYGNPLFPPATFHSICLVLMDTISAELNFLCVLCLCWCWCWLAPAADRRRRFSQFSLLLAQVGQRHVHQREMTWLTHKLTSLLGIVSTRWPHFIHVDVFLVRNASAAPLDAPCRQQPTILIHFSVHLFQLAFLFSFFPFFLLEFVTRFDGFRLIHFDSSFGVHFCWFEREKKLKLMLKIVFWKIHASCNWFNFIIFYWNENNSLKIRKK